MKVIYLILSAPLVSAFSTTSPLQKSEFSSSSQLHQHSVQHEASSSSRRTFFSTAAILSTLMTSRPLPSAAEDLDDLAMPTEEEQKNRDAAEMEERIRRKLELQKKATTSTFKDSLAREKEKQAELKKSKDERRAALCEELGRGC
mmetsp:Transcript_10955/g.20462  ORF Transcript_10955/g.20462 Transcript_10955/m.20462 type:complete len:145 (+) Transcript_10955:715-1149(+)|eukprot:CAMPEP_0176489826 /NCGR_PEP_ID=MMETSP0200_2-20121128/7519_1 /TAXON_ID=947934 /ORGANISM="Chaetoceros sp., Strain GSL56" /LENGTH=144 /DNA_ID=CAMNT_0017887041 /DNA_START=150 /DNA_END=584 /DNA_ORIENTATION=+